MKDEALRKLNARLPAGKVGRVNEVEVKSKVSRTLNARLAAGKVGRVNETDLTFLVPSLHVRDLLPQTTSRAYKFTHEENARFLRVVAACAQVTTHYELFLLMQGEMQFFLPHDILIAAWGDFRAENPKFDVISGLPGMRTNGFCPEGVPLAKRLHQLWVDGENQSIVLNESVADQLQVRNGAACGGACAFHDMRLTLVHGIHNKRDGNDSLYIALRCNPFAPNAADARSRALADIVIHQIDVAYRNVAALQTTRAPSAEFPSSMVLSVREEEITNCMCQGKTNGEIAQILGISVNTVKSHVRRIFDKLGANNRAQAVFKYKDIAENARRESCR